ncbi:DUF1904 family protein [Paenibacillus sp. HJGM_3]|uniref:DUF1904 family protein n=1 Tax=Paenibacillus sp. HJGM_3 TaxID=3379816 RepID=UPI003858F39A
MPHLLVRGITVEQMSRISTPVVDQLAEACSCGRDNFMIDCLPVVSVFDGKQVDPYPFIEVAWFERGDPIRDRVAAILTEHVHSLGIAEVEVAFRTYREDSYYINGVRCD